MDKMIKYQNIIEEIFRKRASSPISNAPEAKGHLIIDKENHEYVLLWLVWSGSSYNPGLMYHVEIKEGKVWIHEDRTDSNLAEILMKEGIPKSDIVLGFVAPYARGLSGFAAA